MVETSGYGGEWKGVNMRIGSGWSEDDTEVTWLWGEIGDDGKG